VVGVDAGDVAVSAYLPLEVDTAPPSALEWAIVLGVLGAMVLLALREAWR
jgi:hypothetical protein